MRRISIETRTLEAAEGFHTALSRFGPDLFQDASGAYRVQVWVGSSAEVAAILSALRIHVTARDDRTATVELDGARYMLHRD